ncbi:MAG: MBL fold metallo-hydrolase [Chloroflexi bacterium]|nr:MBL fold metallo-hydrolase [Chloroflexota bacterium]
MIVETLAVGPLQANCYILGCEQTGEAVVIDPGDEPQRIEAQILQLNLQLKQVIGTHAHLDHILGVRGLCEGTGAPFLLHQLEEPVLAGLQDWTRLWLGYDPGPPPTVDGYLSEDEPVAFGACELEVRLTPGHSPGSVSLVDHEGRRVFVGDLLFQGSIGRSDLPGGDHATLIQSVETQIFTLDDDYAVFTGHGPTTTVGRERRLNPFFQRGGGFWRL